MNKIALLIIIFISSGSIVAQDQVRQQIEKQYLSTSHKTFLYQVSQEIKDADEWALDLESRFRKSIFLAPNFTTSLSTDTTWAYSEYKNLMDSVYAPQTFNRIFYSGDTLNYTFYNNRYVLPFDSTEWMPERLQTSYFSENHNDSSVTYFYRNGESVAYTGQKSRTPLAAAEGATYEQFWDYYNPMDGWMKGSRDLSYRDESDYDTLRKSFQFNAELDEYILEYLQRNRYGENYYLSYNEGYYLGVLNSRDLREETEEYQLREREYFDNEGKISSGNWDFVKLGDGGRYIYQVSKEYDNEKMIYIGQDSLNFEYAQDDSFTEAEGFYWDDSTWVFNQAYTSFQQSHESGKILVDSIIVYDVDYNEESMQNEISGISIKTEMDYDDVGNQIEVRNYSNISDSLQLNSKTVRVFSAFESYDGSIYYTQVKQENYRRDFFTGIIYRSSINETVYDSEGVFKGYKYFNFNVDADTTYGYTIQREVQQDGSTIEVRFDWDYLSKELVLKSYRIFNRRTSGDQGQGFNQALTATVINGQQAISRSMNVYSNYPGIFNDGPIYAEMGDTLVYYISARNPDLSIPEVEVSNMPASATFDPETRRFFWVVDEVDPSPMMYKASRGDKFVTTEVEFITEQFTVGTEEIENPNEFRLSQNYPNPFNPTTNISFNLPSTNNVDLKVYNLLGQEVATLINGRLNSGNHTIKFDASRLASGVYIYRLVSGEFSQTRKMMLIK